MKMKLILTFVSLVFSAQAFAADTAHYFRPWGGFKRTDVSAEKFAQDFPSFMQRTVDLYDGVLNNYFVVIPPANKPSYIPDEFALVALESEEAYRTIRATPDGQAYGTDHWDYFDKATSKSAVYKVGLDEQLVSGVAYDLSPAPLDWSKGHTLFFLGTRKDGLSSAEFLAKLRSHVELAQSSLVPLGMNGYIVVANENYEAAYINWESEEAMNAAFAQVAGQEVGADAREFMDVLMWEPVSPLTRPLSTGVYQSANGGFGN